MNTRKLVWLIGFLLIVSLSCSLFSTTETAPPADVPPAAATLADEGPASVSPTSAPAEELPLIIAAASPAVIDCALFDVTQFNAIVGADFTLVTQDQLGSCNYDADGVYRLLIGGGQPVDSASAKQLFDLSLGNLPSAAWLVYDGGFQLGTAASSVSVTAQGLSAGGNAILIVTTGDPSLDVETLQTTLTKLVVEAARQLNGQW